MNTHPDLKPILESQYLAALEMLRQIVVQCPDQLWNDPQSKNKFWHVAYHAMFFTHLYLHPSAQDFKPWAKHREQYEFLGTLPWPPFDAPHIGEPYSREEVLECASFCRAEVIDRVASLAFTADSGFPWLPFNKLELQLYNIRHLQHHTGELSERLGAQTGLDVAWISKIPD